MNNIIILLWKKLNNNNYFKGGNMDWLQNKTTQIIALVGIVGTLAGFGYTGAELVN